MFFSLFSPATLTVVKQDITAFTCMFFHFSIMSSYGSSPNSYLNGGPACSREDLHVQETHEILELDWYQNKRYVTFTYGGYGQVWDRGQGSCSKIREI